MYHDECKRSESEALDRPVSEHAADGGPKNIGNSQPQYRAPECRDEHSKKPKYSDADRPHANSSTKDMYLRTQPPAEVSFGDLPGMEEYIEELIKLIGIPIKVPEIYNRLGLDPPRGVLLYGPPGCGKTMLAYALASELKVNLLSVSAPSIISGISGESEKKMRSLFDEAKRSAPSIIFIDEIDAITPKRDTAQKEMERRIVSQLLICMDDISSGEFKGKPVIVIGATNRQDSIDPALRRAGRFDREINIRIPTGSARAKIIERLCSHVSLAPDVDFLQLAKLTPGYVGADLKSLVLEAGLQSVERIFRDILVPLSDNQDASTRSEVFTNAILMYGESSKAQELLSNPKTSDSLVVRHEDFIYALSKVQPSSKREGFITSASGVTWDDIGAMSTIREELRMYVVEPIRNPELYRTIGMIKPTGILLYGPPGCGKTLVAKAVANESHSNFISVNGPELLNKYVGESERAIRTVFSRAQASAPCIIFFDELDAICPSRSSSVDTQYSSRVVNTLLTEMDGMNERKQVYVIAATNRPELIDGAMLRPGRLDKTLYVNLPNKTERVHVLKAITKKLAIDTECDLSLIAHDPRCDGFSCADLSALVREASMIALNQKLSIYNDLGRAGVIDGVVIGNDHFMIALSKMRPSVEKKDRRRYELLRARFSNHDDIVRYSADSPLRPNSAELREE